MTSKESVRLLGADGPFASALEGFAPRDAQLRMAEAVEEAFAGGGSLVVEAGTGIGKTLAYLVPALAAAALAGLEGDGVTLACLAILAGRAWFVAFYYTGLPFMRIPGFTAAALGALYLILRILGLLG